jgi:hypothetical protein
MAVAGRAIEEGERAGAGGSGGLSGGELDTGGFADGDEGEVLIGALVAGDDAAGAGIAEEHTGVEVIGEGDTGEGVERSAVGAVAEVDGCLIRDGAERHMRITFAAGAGAAAHSSSA